MELENMKDLWREYDQKLEKQVQLNLRLVNTMKIDKTKSAISKFIKTPSFGLAIGLIAVMFLSFFIVGRFDEPWYAATAALIWPFAMLQVVFSGYQLSVVLPTSEGGEMSYDLPVIEIQKKLEKLTIYRLRYLSVTRFAYGFLWLPVLIVALKVFWDFDFYLYFNETWLLFMFGFGITCVSFGIWLSIKFADKEPSSPLLKKIRNGLASGDMAGKSIADAAAFLKEIGEFEQEEESTE